MKRILMMLLLTATVFSIDACKSNSSTSPSTTTPTPDAIVGTWVATGFDSVSVAGVTYVVPEVSPVLYYSAALKTRRIQAVFNASGTYTVLTTDSAGTNVTYTGTWATAAGNGTGANATIRTITVNQSSPYAVISQGIYQVAVSGNATKMLYEIAPTSPPSVGVTPPTASAGFGSTSGGAYGITNIQRYTKQ
jgi:hypothetical protein